MPKAIAGRWAVLLTALFVCGAQAQGAADRLGVCAGCHGADGNSVTAGVPSLAGQPRVFLENYLVLTREGIAGTDVMRQLLKGVPDREIVLLASHFSALPVKASSNPVDKNLFQKGKQVAAANRCGSCHLPDFSGREQMPRLAGQREEYLAEAMHAYRQNRRPGGDTIMAAALYGIPEADLKALAHYLSRLR
ncbi:MAG: c-type cytochrome [Pseudomonadota bacterium]